MSQPNYENGENRKLYTYWLNLMYESTCDIEDIYDSKKQCNDYAEKNYFASKLFCIDFQGVCDYHNRALGVPLPWLWSREPCQARSGMRLGKENITG